MSDYQLGRYATGVTTDDLCDRRAGFLTSMSYKASCRCTRISGKFILYLSGTNVLPELHCQRFRFLIARNNYRWTVGDAGIALGGYNKAGTGVPAAGLRLYTDFVNNSRMPQYEILYDKSLILPPVGDLGTSTGLDIPPSFTFNIQDFSFEFDMDCDFPVWYRYNVADQKWESIVGGCGIFFWTEVSGGNILTPAWKIHGTLRMRWNDMKEKKY